MPANSRQLLVRSLYAGPQGDLLRMCLVMLLFGDISSVLEEPSCKGVILSLDPVVFLLSYRDVKGPWPNAVGGPLLVDSWPIV